MNWNLNCGVIVIGSLLWQDHLEKHGDNIRLNWRNSHLDLTNKIPVKIPIRYGRKSKSGIPTMVYSNRMKSKTGFAYVIPFKKKINNIDDLTQETLALSIAEGMKGNFVRTWGVLTYLFNDNKIDQELKRKLVSFFRQRKNMSFDISEYKVKRERSCITKSLKLNIDWVKPINEVYFDKLNQLDFLLATATKPENRILSYEEIALGVKNDKERYYFINNIGNGIITQEDFEISKRL